MPEAAEVETLRRQLEPFMPFRVMSVDVTGHRTVRAHTPERLQALVGSTLSSAVRRGKWLGLRGDEVGLRVHLRMSGRLLLEDEGVRVPHQHATFVVESADGARHQLGFIDPRTFGEVALWEDTALGFDSVDVLDTHRDAEAADRLAKARRCLKDVLLDQRAVVQGVGNIYADEVCHVLGVRPDTACSAISPAVSAALMEAIRGVVEAAVGHRGTALRDEGWSDLHGVLGGHGEHLMVHEQAQCRRCLTAVVKTKVAGRTTYWCPECQQ